MSKPTLLPQSYGTPRQFYDNVLANGSTTITPTANTAGATLIITEIMFCNDAAVTTNTLGLTVGGSKVFSANAQIGAGQNVTIDCFLVLTVGQTVQAATNNANINLHVTGIEVI